VEGQHPTIVEPQPVDREDEGRLRDRLTTDLRKKTNVQMMIVVFVRRRVSASRHERGSE